ncbi:LysM peptidoglycan-binding domain-containing protein [Verrucomicrobiota bacterium sgz303538]
MNRIPALARPCALLFIAANFAAAQDPAPAPAAPDELRSLRQAIEQQTKQLEMINQQLTEINRRLSAAPPHSPSTSTSSTPSAPAAAAAPAASPAPSAPAPSAPAPTQAEPAKPEAVNDGSKHTVAKGETLTSIAKRYNIPLAELEKANKITDDRKLQIGQVLNIPTAANKTPETPTEKKETP